MAPEQRSIKKKIYRAKSETSKTVWKFTTFI